MNYILDTSAYAEFNRGNSKLKKWFSLDNIIIVPMIVVGELRAGFVFGTKQVENEQLLQKFLDSPNVAVVSLSDKTTKHFADIYSQLRRSATPIGTNDLWISAIAKEFDKPVLTMDEDFKYVKSIQTVKT